MSKNALWPENCAWPEPIWNGEGIIWDTDTAMMMDLDEEGEELQSIREYYDSLVDEGRLNDDYSLNHDYQEFYETEDDDFGEPDDEEWTPEMGEDYWDDGFMVDAWEEDISENINCLKADINNLDSDPMIVVRPIIGYDFINENLLRQAFTRRSFSTEYDLSGCSEELEFYGDQILGMVITREMYNRFSEVDIRKTDAPFCSIFNEGGLSKIRSHFVSKEHLSKRAVELGLDRFILYGSGEAPSDSACEDMIEALIGAVAVDSGWNWNAIEDVVDSLVCIQLDQPDELLKKTYYEMLNSWHQKRFQRVPEYEVHRHFKTKAPDTYYCTLRFTVPENDKDISTYQRIDVENSTRSSARELAARKAVFFLKDKGLWMNLKDAGIVPDLENSINQLQELYQKKYVEEPVYTFEQISAKEWYCSCVCESYVGWGRAVGKVRAKKEAAFMVLGRIFCEKAHGVRPH